MVRNVHVVLQGNLIGSIGRLVEGGDDAIKQICATALNQLPQDMVKLDEKMVKARLMCMHIN